MHGNRDDNHIFLERFLEQKMNNSDDLILAISVGSLDVVKHILESEHVDIDVVNHRGHSPLCVASAYGHKDIVKYLIENSADVNKPLGGTKTKAIHIAASNGFSDIVNILRDNGADIRARDHGGLSALDYSGISPQPVNSDSKHLIDRVEYADEQLVNMRRQCLRALS